MHGRIGIAVFPEFIWCTGHVSPTSQWGVTGAARLRDVDRTTHDPVCAVAKLAFVHTTTTTVMMMMMMMTRTMLVI